jgi:riboflavin synthase
MGGHWVTGHIDGIGVIVDKVKERDFFRLKIQIPGPISKYVVEKGSVAIDGISLTVNACEAGEIQMTLIPYTLDKTTLIDKRVGDRVNVEADILGKYVEKLLNQGMKPYEKVSFSFLKKHGFTDDDEED